MYPEIKQQQERLKRLYSQAEALTKMENIDEELQAQFVWYLCVRTSGYLEFSTKTILRKYVQEETGALPVANFVNSQLDRTLNPWMDHICDLIGKFNKSWKQNLQKATKGDIKDAIDSIVRNRNAIAHGNDAQLTFKELQRYFEYTQQVIELMYNECNNPQVISTQQES